MKLERKQKNKWQTKLGTPGLKETLFFEQKKGESPNEGKNENHGSLKKLEQVHFSASDCALSGP